MVATAGRTSGCARTQLPLSRFGRADCRNRHHCEIEMRLIPAMGLMLLVPTAIVARVRSRSLVTGSDLRHELEAANLDAARSAVGCVPLHAAAIDSTAGVIALAGRSGSGKSTLAAAAVLAGYGYVADEVTVVSPEELRVRPFHRPIGLRRGGAQAIGISYPDSPDGRYESVYPWNVSGRGVLSAGGTLRGIVLVDRRAETEPAIGAVDVPKAMVELCQHTVIPDEQLGEAFGFLEQIVRVVPVVRMTYATVEESLVLLGRLVERWTE